MKGMTRAAGKAKVDKEEIASNNMEGRRTEVLKKDGDPREEYVL